MHLCSLMFAHVHLMITCHILGPSHGPMFSMFVDLYCFAQGMWITLVVLAGMASHLDVSYYTVIAGGLSCLRMAEPLPRSWASRFFMILMLQTDRCGDWQVQGLRIPWNSPQANGVRRVDVWHDELKRNDMNIQRLTDAAVWLAISSLWRPRLEGMDEEDRKAWHGSGCWMTLTMSTKWQCRSFNQSIEQVLRRKKGRRPLIAQLKWQTQTSRGCFLLIGRGCFLLLGSPSGDLQHRKFIYH